MAAKNWHLNLGKDVPGPDGHWHLLRCLQSTQVEGSHQEKEFWKLLEMPDLEVESFRIRTAVSFYKFYLYLLMTLPFSLSTVL